MSSDDGVNDEVVGLDQVDADGEPPEFDLTPRTSTKGAAPVGGDKRKRLLAAGVLVIIAFAAGFLVTKALGSATDYFYRVDEAVAHRANLGTRRFRIQGTVTNSPKSVKLTENSQKIRFSVEANGVTVPVIYVGSDPPALFARCEPVVIAGHWQSSADNAPFIGSQIIIKHTENYSAKHADRLQADPTCKETETE